MSKEDILHWPLALDTLRSTSYPTVPDQGGIAAKLSPRVFTRGIFIFKTLFLVRRHLVIFELSEKAL